MANNSSAVVPIEYTGFNGYSDASGVRLKRKLLDKIFEDTYTLVLRSLSSKLAFIYWWSPIQDVRHHGTGWNYPLTKSSFITLLCTNILLLDRSVVVLYSYIDSAINTFCCRNYISKQPNICIKGVWFLPSKKKEMRKSVYLTNERFSLFPY